MCARKKEKGEFDVHIHQKKYPGHLSLSRSKASKIDVVCVCLSDMVFW